MSAFTETEKPKIHKEAEVKKENNFIGSKRLRKGHTLFEVNASTGEIKIAEYQTKDVFINSDNSTTKRKTVIVRENCIYIGALNVENVKKKLSKLNN